MEINVWACFPHGLWEDTSAIIKPCFCVGIVGGGTVHLFLLDFLDCSVFSNSRIGNSFRYCWRHVTFFHRMPLIVILNWFPCVVRCSFRSSGRLLIAHAIMVWYHCFIFLVPGSIPAYLGASVAFSNFMVSSSNSRLMVCRENARAS